MGRMHKRYEEDRGEIILESLEQITGKKLPQNLTNKLVHGVNEEDIIASGLEDTMRMSFQEILEMKTQFKLEDYRMAAYAIAIKKIEKSYLELGI